VTLSGKIGVPDKSLISYKYVDTAFSVTIEDSRDFLEVKASIEDKDKLTDYIALKYNSPDDERIHGLGLQPTDWNFKGKLVPVVTSEGGIGRGLEPITKLVDIVNRGGGGNELTTYTTSWSYITNHHRAIGL